MQTFGFNPLEIGSTLQNNARGADRLVHLHQFQSPRNRVNTSKLEGTQSTGFLSAAVSIP